MDLHHLLHHLLHKQALLLVGALHQAHQAAAVALVETLQLASTAARNRRHGVSALHLG